MHGSNTTEENGEVVIGSRHEAYRLYGKELMYSLMHLPTPSPNA